jgi:hypothetical protein
MLSEKPQVIKSKEEFISLISKMLSNENAAGWENVTAHDYLEALARWIEDCDGFYSNLKIPMNTESASWQLFADALQAATVYE